MYRKFSALMIPLAMTLAVATPASAGSSQCRPTGHILARRGGAVVWSVTQKGRVTVYACSPPQPRRNIGVTSGSSSLHPDVQNLKLAGNFMSFVLTTGTNKWSSLFVYNVASSRKEVSVFADCVAPSSAGCGRIPHLVSYYLGANGWVAELFSYPARYINESIPNVSYESLVATNSQNVSYPIDLATNISGVSLSGGTLRWTSDFGGASSVSLGSDLVPPSASLPLTACQAVTPADASAANGAVTSGSSTSPTNCFYSNAVSVGVQTGLSAPNTSGAVSSVSEETWPPNESYRFFETGSFGGPGAIWTDQVWGFVNGTEVAITVTNYGGGGGDRPAWLAEVGYDRLFGIPVQRTS